jgi:stage II sporulation protein Q
MYNETLKQWEAHMAIDLTTTGNSNVYAVLDGKVSNVYKNYLDGNVVVIEHANNLKTIYKSLDSTSSLKVGDMVSKGQVIGTTGLSASEAHLGNHLHFEVEENNKKIDPSGYLNLTDK